MPLPLIVGGITAVAGIASVYGGVKMKEANDKKEQAQQKQKEALNRFKEKNDKCTQVMDELGKIELEILSTFENFSNLIERIQYRPEFKKYSKDEVDIPEYEAEELQKVSTGAGILLGGLGDAAAGTAGGFAAAGVTNSAIMALGTTGAKLLDKADEAYNQATRTEKEVDKVCKYLDELMDIAKDFFNTLKKVDKKYRERLKILDSVINITKKTSWDVFSDKEKILTKNLVLLVGILYEMCKVNLVIKNDDDNSLNEVNRENIIKVCKDAEKLLEDIEIVA